MGDSRLMLSYEDFETALRNWQLLTNTIEPSTFGFYTTEFLPLFNSKTDNAKKSCELPNDEFIFLLYDKTFFGKCDFCTVIGRFGIYSCEEQKKHFYDGVKNNFVSWEKFLRAGLFSRHKERIYLDGEYIINGFTNSKKLFLLLNELRLYLSKCYPYYFVTPCYTVPVSDIKLKTEELESVILKSAPYFLREKEKKKQFFFEKSEIELEPLNTIKNLSKSSEGTMALFKREKYITLFSLLGIESFEYNKKKQTTKKYIFTTWKELLRSQSLLETNHKLYIDGKLVCMCGLGIFHLVVNLHILLGSMFIQRVTQPPTYDEIRASFLPSMENFTNLKSKEQTSSLKQEIPLSLTPPVGRRRKSSIGGAGLKEKERRKSTKDLLIKVAETVFEEVITTEDSETHQASLKNKVEPLTQVISFGSLSFVDPPPYHAD